MMRYILSIIIAFVIFACESPQQNETKELHNGYTSGANTSGSSSEINETELDKLEEIEEDNYSYKIIETESIGYGYQILNNDKLYINQPHIPSVQGNIGFSDESKAITAANYIIYKLENGLFPPTVSPTELDSLGVM